MAGYILALDQGTTSSRAILFREDGSKVSAAQYAFEQHYPKSAWVEHDPKEILSSQFRAMRDCMAAAQISPSALTAIGITNQRETVVLWERETGEPVYPAIVWQCRRTAAYCDALKAQGMEEMVREKNRASHRCLFFRQ